MSELPKIVQDRLRAGMPGGGHPDADVLTALAEQALSGTEREDVVRHLSRCVDCREVVALSIPPTESVAHYEADREGVRAATGTTSTGFRGWFAWPHLRWAAMAAAVVVVASVLVLRPGKQQQSMVDTVNQRAERIPSSTDASANGGIVASEQPAQMIGSSQETVVVNGAAADVVQPAPMEERGLTARNEITPPIEKAKPAVKEEAQLKKQAQDSGTQNKLAAA